MTNNFHALPDLEGYESAGAKKARKLIREWQTAFKTVGAVETEVEQAIQALEDAKTRDVGDRAIAARKGKADPGRPNEEKAHADLAALKDRLGVVRQVLTLVEQDLSAALIENAPAISEEASEKRQAELEHYAELAPQLRAAHDAAQYHGGVAKWATTPNAYFNTLPALSAVLDIPMSISSGEADEANENEGTVINLAG